MSDERDFLTNYFGVETKEPLRVSRWGEQIVMRAVATILLFCGIGCVRSHHIAANIKIENQLYQFPDASLSCGRKFNDPMWACVVDLDHGWHEQQFLSLHYRSYHRYVFTTTFKVPAAEVHNFAELVGRRWYGETIFALMDYGANYRSNLISHSYIELTPFESDKNVFHINIAGNAVFLLPEHPHGILNKIEQADIVTTQLYTGTPVVMGPEGRPDEYLSKSGVKHKT